MGKEIGEVYGNLVAQKEKVPDTIDTVWKAAAYGDTDVLKELLEADAAAANVADPSGYRPLHWAALNNRVAAMTLLFQYGAQVDAVEPGGQTALHWAATRGSIPAVELLLRTDATLHLQDSRGYTVCHVAAQYGQTALLHHLALKWHTDVDAPDFDGRSPLHWAAYKGFGDPIRLLLCLGGRALMVDKEGCTALHWAALKGHSEACTLLVQGGGAEALTMVDTTGSTPSQLAAQKGHMMCADWLAHERAKVERKAAAKGFFRGGAPRGLKHLAPVLWCIILGLLVGFMRAVVMSTTLGPRGTPSTLAAYVVVLSCVGGMGFLLRAGIKDPGFICCKGEAREGQGCKDDEQAEHKPDMDDQVLWDGHWHMLCLQCKRVRPARSKYCRVSERCVSRFDHYCPWIGNAVGERNHRDFVIFLCLETLAMAVSFITAVGRLLAVRQSLRVLMETHMVVLVFCVFDGVVLLSVFALTCSQLTQVFQNITTNEMMNLHRYKYLHAEDGSFANPFDKGCWPNAIDFFGIECVASGGVTDAPSTQRLEERTGLLLHSHGHTHGGASATAAFTGAGVPTLCGKLCSGLCQPVHAHSHGYSRCCKKEVRDIEDGRTSSS